ncbi:MAG TPA: serine/threonine-protein kinase, partial [Caulobacteraceae bacterium]|nr:serine/threonine-protein kinase [Caulobacteraceae bacterium]
MASWNGRQFGKYIIHEEAGRGGMARVFRATDTSLQRAVALKVLSAQLANDPDASQRFAREAITAANLRHPNIVTIFDVGEIESIPYIAMEYIAGRTLQAVIDERGAMGLGYAVALLEPVAEALDFAHTQQLVHRDIKPHNILINADGRVLLTDFGIAQAPVAGGQRLTRSGMFMGTPEYIAPEQASAQPVDGRSDLYSLGIVAFEVITGQVPFSGSVPELLVAHAYTAPPPISTVVSGMPPALDKVFARALAKKPDERPPSAIALVDALRSLCVRSGGIIPDRGEIAALAIPRGSSAGKETMALPAATPLPPAAPPRQSNPSAATDVGSITPPPRSVPPRTPAPAPRPAPRPAPAAPPPARPPARQAERPAARPRTQTRAQPRRSVTTSDPIKTAFPFIFAGLLVVLGIVYWQRSGGPGLVATPFPSNVITNGGGGLSGTAGVVETRLPTSIPSDTPSPTGVPTVESTPTDAPPTETLVPDAPTQAPAPTARPAAPTA